MTCVFPTSRFLVNSYIKENCHNSITSNDIDMKLEAVTKLGNRNSATSKKTDNDVTSANYDAMVIFPIYGQVSAIRKPDPGRMVRRTDIFINSNLLCDNNGTRNTKTRT